MVTFRVFGDPRPQGSKRAFVNRKTGKPILTESAGQPLKDWRSRVADAVRSVVEPTAEGRGVTVIVHNPPFDGPVSVRMVFWLRPPKKKPRWPSPAQRPDLGKLARAVEDEMYPLILRDDSQIVTEHLSKQWATDDVPPGVSVSVEVA